MLARGIKKTRLFSISSLWLALAAALLGQTPLPEEVFPPLREIVRRAQAQSPRALAANLSVMEAEAQAQVRAAGRWPRVDGLAQYEIRREERRDLPAASNSEKFYYSLQLTQPIYHWGALVASQRIGQIQEEIARNQLAEAYQNLALEVRAQYLQGILKNLSLRGAEENIRRSEERLASAERRAREGVGSENELEGLRLQVEEARLAADRTAADLEDFLRGFARLSGVPLTRQDLPDQIPALDVADSAGSGATRPGAEPTLAEQNLRRELDKERLNYQITRVRLRPRLNFVAGATQDEISYTVNLADKFAVNYVFAGVQLVWPIFDGWETRGLKRASLVRQDALARQLVELEKSTGEQSLQRRLELEFAARGLRLAERRLEIAAEQVRHREEDLARGLVSQGEVDSAREHLAQVIFGVNAARADYLTRSAEVLSSRSPATADAESTLP